MNKQTPAIVKGGVTAIIGKGGMSSEVIRALTDRCFYLAFPGGCGILAKERIEEVLDVYYAELGFTEAVWKLQVRDFCPLLVIIDSHGESIYENIQASSRSKLSQ
jgi:fumarate hydratase subunit beta